MAEQTQPDPSTLRARLAALQRAQEARRRRPLADAGTEPEMAHSLTPTSSRASLPRSRSAAIQAPAAANVESSWQAKTQTAQPPEFSRHPEPTAVAPAGSAPGAQAPSFDDRLPVGSAFSWQQWDEARDGDANIVFEVHNDAGNSALLAWPRETMSRTVEAFLFDGCLLLAPRAPHPYPDAVCGEVKLKNVEYPWTYRVVRPQAHRKDLFFMFGARGTVDFNPVQVDALRTAAAPKQLALPRSASEPEAEPAGRDRPRPAG